LSTFRVLLFVRRTLKLLPFRFSSRRFSSSFSATYPTSCRWFLRIFNILTRIPVSFVVPRIVNYIFSLSPFDHLYPYSYIRPPYPLFVLLLLVPLLFLGYPFISFEVTILVSLHGSISYHGSIPALVLILCLCLFPPSSSILVCLLFSLFISRPLCSLFLGAHYVPTFYGSTRPVSHPYPSVSAFVSILANRSTAQPVLLFFTFVLTRYASSTSSSIHPSTSSCCFDILSTTMSPLKDTSSSFRPWPSWVCPLTAGVACTQLSRLLLLFCSGCATVSPLSPILRQNPVGFSVLSHVSASAICSVFSVLSSVPAQPGFPFNITVYCYLGICFFACPCSPTCFFVPSLGLSYRRSTLHLHLLPSRLRSDFFCQSQLLPLFSLYSLLMAGLLSRFPVVRPFRCSFEPPFLVALVSPAFLHTLFLLPTMQSSIMIGVLSSGSTF
jgi:hypothetical protein